MKQCITAVAVILILFTGCKSDDKTAQATVVGGWDQTVNIVGNPIAVTVLIFSGSESGGTFVNSDGNGGNWTFDGDSIRFQYVPAVGVNLISEFTGGVDSSFTQLNGYANGEFDNTPFHGTWTASKVVLLSK